MGKKDREYNGRSDYQLSISRYLGLASIIILLLVLIFGISNLDYFIRKNNELIHMNKVSKVEQAENMDIIHREGIGDDSFILVQDENKSGIIGDGLKKAKIKYSSISSLKEIKEIEGNLILDGDMIKDMQDLEILKEFIKKKKNIVFLSMPKINDIRNYGLEEIFGIADIKGPKFEKELTLVPGFMLGGLHEFKDMSYTSCQVELLSSTKTYGFGDEKSGVIWRNVYMGSEIYIVNGSFMETNASYGILSALMSEIYSDYIYPVVNARLMTYEGLPYISYENTGELEKTYNRNAMKFQQDILFPDILSINRRREYIPNGYLKVGFNNMYRGEISDDSIKQVNNHKEQIYKYGGEVGIMYSGDIEYDKSLYNDIFKDEKIKSILIKEDIDDLEKLIEASASLEAVLGPWKDRVSSFEYLDEDTVYIPFTVEGVENSDQKELEFISGLTAFGAIIENLALEDVVMLKEGKGDWTSISRSYIRFIDKYRERFSLIEDRNISETSKAVKIFRNSSPKIESSPNKIQIRLDEFYGDSYYILRTDKEIDNIINGEAEKIEEGAYLISARDELVEIYISPKKIYEYK